jgi:hypothetical protein
MLKLAQMRQTVENGMDTLASLNSLPKSMVDRTQELKDKVAQAIPFTPRDVLALQQSQDPTMTLAKLLESKGAPMASGQPERTLGGQEVLPPNPKGQELPLVNDKGWQLLEDAQGNLAYVSPDGREIEEVK